MIWQKAHQGEMVGDLSYAKWGAVTLL